MRTIQISLTIIHFISQSLCFTITDVRTDNGAEIDHPARTDSGGEFEGSLKIVNGEVRIMHWGSTDIKLNI